MKVGVGLLWVVSDQNLLTEDYFSSLTNFYLSTLQEREFFSSQLLVNSSAILDLHIKVIWFLHSYSQQFINCQKSRFSFVCNTRAKRAKMLWFCFYTEIELKFYNYILVTFDALIFVRTFIMRTNFQTNFGSNCALIYNWFLRTKYLCTKVLNQFLCTIFNAHYLELTFCALNICALVFGSLYIQCTNFSAHLFFQFHSNSNIQSWQLRSLPTLDI